ncbi:hypothetical protein V8C86DRAFT_2436735 [Haematococcus lacustris]
MRVDDPISEAEEEEQQQGKAPAKQKARQGGTPKTPSRRLDPAQHHTPTRVGGGGAAAPVPAPQPGSAGRQLNQQPRVKFGLDYPIPNVGHGELALQPLPGEVEDWWWPVVYEAIQGYMIQDWVAKYGRKLPPAWTFATGDKKVKEAVQQQRTQWSRFKKDAGLAGKTQQVSKPVEKETAKWWSQLGCLRKRFGAQWRHEQWKDNLAVVHHLRDHGVLPELLPASWVVGSVPVDMEGDPAPLATPALDTWTPFLRDDLQRVAGDVASTAGIQVDTAWQVVHEEMDSLMPEFKALLQRLGDGALARATSHPQRQQQQEQGQQQLGQQQQQTHPELNIQASLARYNDDVLKGKMIRLAADTVLAYTGYSSGEDLMLPDEDDINSLNPGNWMTSGAFSSLINSMQFWKPSAYDGPRPMLLPVELARVFSPIFDSNTPTPAPVEAWQELYGYFCSVHRVQELKSAACIILPVHHDNHYFFVVFFRQVKRVVFFDSGKQFNPNWPTQLMKDTFTEVAEEIFSDGDERWVFEEGTITQQPDAIHCADYTLTGINAILQAADVRYCRAIDLANINMASQRRTWLKPYLEVTVTAVVACLQRMIAEQGTCGSEAASLMMMLVVLVVVCVGCSPISEGGNPPAETPHAGAALATSSSASPPRGAAEVAGTAGQAKASSGELVPWVQAGQEAEGAPAQ